MKTFFAMTAAALALAAGVWAQADEGPSMSDLQLLTVPRGELPPGEADLATKLEFARAMILGGKAAEALTTLDEISARDLAGNFTVEVFYYKAFAFDMLGKYDAAVANYQEALTRRPDDPVILLALGQAYLDAGKDDDARASFDKVLAKTPEDSQALTGLAYLDMRGGDDAAARAKLERAVVADGRNALALSYLGLLEMGEHQFDLARKHLEDAVALAPENLTANYNLAGIYLMQKDYAKAELHYRRVVTKKPADGDAWYYLALALEAQNRIDEALDAADAAVQHGASVGNVIEMVDRLQRKLNEKK